MALNHLISFPNHLARARPPLPLFGQCPFEKVFLYEGLPEGKADPTAFKFRQHRRIVHCSGHLAPWSILRHGTRSPRPPQPTTRSPHPPPSPSKEPPSPPHPLLSGPVWPWNSQQQQHDGGRRQKIVSVLRHSLVLLLVGGSTGRWAGLPRREEEGGRRTPGPGHQTREHTVNSLLLSTPRSFHIRHGQDGKL